MIRWNTGQLPWLYVLSFTARKFLMMCCLTRIRKPAHFEQVPEPRNREDCGRCKKYLGLYGGVFTLTLVCVAAAGLLVVRQWEAWLRGDHWPVINQRPHQIQISIKRRFLSSGSSCFFHLRLSPWILLVLDPTGRVYFSTRNTRKKWKRLEIYA